MKAERNSATYIFEVEHIGLDMDFHHPQGRDLRLAPDVVEAFEAQREHAEIFVQNSSSLGFSGEELLDWFLLQTGTTLEDHLPGEALAQAPGHVYVTFPIRFEPNTFHMMTEDGPQDLKALKMMAKVSFHRRTA